MFSCLGLNPAKKAGIVWKLKTTLAVNADRQLSNLIHRIHGRGNRLQVRLASISQVVSARITSCRNTVEVQTKKLIEALDSIADLFNQGIDIQVKDEAVSQLVKVLGSASDFRLIRRYIAEQIRIGRIDPRRISLLHITDGSEEQVFPSRPVHPEGGKWILPVGTLISWIQEQRQSNPLAAALIASLE